MSGTAPKTPPSRPILFSGPMVLALLAGDKTQTRRLVKDVAVRCPLFDPGDRLWVRERWRLLGAHDGRLTVEYAADGAVREVEARLKDESGDRVRSPLFLPRAAARIHLDVVAVRQERLQDITESDAQAEGTQESAPDFRSGFQSVWGRLHGPESWTVNPRVWVVSFTVTEP